MCDHVYNGFIDSTTGLSKDIAKSFIYNYV
jgi:hypothetical protein